MKNKNLWQPTKYILKNGKLKASKNTKEVGRFSYFIANIQAKIYQELLQKHARGVLLDLGCGKVPLFLVYKDQVSDTICIDWENTYHKNPFLDFETDINNGIPLPDNHVDTILMTDVLEHIYKPIKTWSEMKRVLKPTGKIILSVPFFYWIHESPYDFYRYTEHSLRRYCLENDLKILCLKPYGGVIEIILDIIAKNLKSSLLLKIHILFSTIIMKFSIVKNFSRKNSKYFPLGYCLVAQKK